MSTIHAIIEQILSVHDVSKAPFNNTKLDELLTSLSDVDIKDLAVSTIFLSSLFDHRDQPSEASIEYFRSFFVQNRSDFDTREKSIERIKTKLGSFERYETECRPYMSEIEKARNFN